MAGLESVLWLRLLLINDLINLAKIVECLLADPCFLGFPRGQSVTRDKRTKLHISRNATVYHQLKISMIISTSQLPSACIKSPTGLVSSLAFLLIKTCIAPWTSILFPICILNHQNQFSLLVEWRKLTYLVLCWRAVKLQSWTSSSIICSAGLSIASLSTIPSLTFSTFNNFTITFYKLYWSNTLIWLLKKLSTI